LSPDQSRRINGSSAGWGFGEGQVDNRVAREKPEAVKADSGESGGESNDPDRRLEKSADRV